MQTVNFPPLPGTKPADFIPKLTSFYRFIENEPEADLRAFKRHLKENDLFDKETFENLVDFLGFDTTKGKPLGKSKFLDKIYQAADHTERQKLVFMHIAKKNEILVKYVMDGLAERLYSTNEMYRYITSYVYPGEYITLVNFRAWMDWLQASEHIKMIGIRWGLSPLGEEAMNYIKVIDVDELLEGISDDDADDDDDDDADGDEDAAPAAAADEGEGPGDDGGEEPAGPAPMPAPGARPGAAAPRPMAPAMAGPAPAMPAATPAAVSMAMPATAVLGAPQLVVPAGVETVRVMVQPFRPEPDEEPLRLVREAFAAADEEEETDEQGEPTEALPMRLDQLRLDEEQVAENVRAVLAWWQSRPGGKLLRASDYGFQKDVFEREPAYALFRFACLAVSLFRHQGRLNVGKGGEAFAMLDQMGFFENLFKSRQSVDEILEGLFKGGLAGRPELFGNLHYFLLFRRALQGLRDDGVMAWAELEGADEVVGALWQHLGHFSLHYEIFWIARELHVLGVWENEVLAELGVVPLPKVRETAFRLGLLETPYAADFPSLVGVSRRLSRLFGKQADWEAPLVYFEPRRELRYDASEPRYFAREQLGID